MYSKIEEEQYQNIHFQKRKEIFEKRGFEVFIFEKKEEAVNHFLSSLKPEQMVAYGGSTSVKELELIEKIKEKKIPLLDRNHPENDTKKKAQIERDSFKADIYLASANAISETGEIVNIDMWGNRNAAIEFGPQKVCLFIGKNKWAKNLEEALWRARNIASPMNCMRFNRKTPCVKDGLCHDCSSSERICSIISILTRSAVPQRISLYWIAEDLGF